MWIRKWFVAMLTGTAMAASVSGGPVSDPIIAAKAAFERGQTALQKEDYVLAIREFTEAIRLNPNYAEAYLCRGNMYIEFMLTKDFKVERIPGDGIDKIKMYIDNYELVFADYNQAIRLNQNYAEAYYRRGHMYNNYKGDYSQAIADWNNAIRLDPTKYVTAEMYTTRGTAYYHNGDTNRAIADFKSALQIDPNYSNAQKYLEISQKKK